ncbi:MAG: DsbE family thiol:disulfide interchange protein [Betaproteobacteria bacterium]
MNRWIRAGLPLALFLVIAWFLLKGLDRNPRDIPSPLINKAAPSEVLEGLDVLDMQSQALRVKDLKGQVWLLNVWGSWCSGCQVEHLLLNRLAAEGLLPIVGLAWKDSPAQSRDWLSRLGNPYATVLMDLQGKAAIEWGVYGAPETFLIDKDNTVRFKHVGPLTADIIDKQLRPMIEQLKP